MAEKWTDRDREAFAKKDAQQAKGYSIEQAIKIEQAHLNVDNVLKTAEKILIHTTQKVSTQDVTTQDTTTPKETKTPPKSSEMSNQARNVYNKIVEEYAKIGEVDEEKLKVAILKFKGKFPRNMASVAIVLKNISPDDVVKQ